MATVPTVQVWSTGQFVTSSQMNAGVGNVLTWLLAPPRAIVYRNASYSLSSNVTPSAITWTTELVDTDTMWNAGHPTRLTFNTAGLYYVENQFHMAATTAGSLDSGVALNSNGSWSGNALIEGTSPNAGSSYRNGLCQSFSYYFNVGDYIEAFASQNSGSSVTAMGSTYFDGHLGARWIATS